MNPSAPKGEFSRIASDVKFGKDVPPHKTVAGKPARVLYRNAS